MDNSVVAKEYYGEGKRVYRCFIKKVVEQPGELTGKGSTSYFFIDSNGKSITSRWASTGDDGPIWVGYYNGSPTISVKPEVKKCLESAAKNHTQVEITGNWRFAGEGTEGFDEQSVTCKNIK